MRKTLIIVGIILLLIIILWAVYYFVFKVKSCSGISNPGVGSPCACDQAGDNTVKFYGDNWRARGAVCDGLYIPSGVDLKGQDPIRVLEKMEDLYSANNALKTNMNQLAISGVNQAVATV